MNSVARVHYNYFTNEVIELNDFFDIPNNGEYYIFGECGDFQYYLAYAGTLVTQDTLLLGNANTQADSYWAIKLKDGAVVATWSSYYPLQESQLLIYTMNEQYKQINFFEDLSNSKVIGYYEKESD
ncbi:MAG: hypothetical protein K2G88_05955 [Oscillospiraceae bacterium]|nr:hypothetical protein [Oscillospiraceae bacterium]